MSFFNAIREFVKTGRISQQSAYLAQLIEAGVRTKEELAIELGKTVRTVERQLKELYEAGLIHSTEGLLAVTTKMSLDQIDISIYKDIDSIDENVQVINKVASLFKCSPQRVRQAMINAQIDDISLAEEAARITLQRKPRSPIAYFCVVLRNMKNAIKEKTEEVSFIWEDICRQVKPVLGRASFTQLFLPTKCVKNNGKLYLQGTTASTLWHLYSDLLKSFGIAGLLAGHTLQEAI